MDWIRNLDFSEVRSGSGINSSGSTTMDEGRPTFVNAEGWQKIEIIWPCPEHLARLRGEGRVLCHPGRTTHLALADQSRATIINLKNTQLFIEESLPLRLRGVYCNRIRIDMHLIWLPGSGSGTALGCRSASGSRSDKIAPTSACTYYVLKFELLT